MHEEQPDQNGALARRRQRGTTVVAVMITIALVSVGLMGVVGPLALGTLMRRRDVEMRGCSAAVDAILEQTVPPSDDGGSVYPHEVVSNYSDIVWADPGTGAVSRFAVGDSGPAGAVPVRRQWMVSTDAATGLQSLAASAVVVDSQSGAIRATRVVTNIGSKVLHP